jgi:hypothetical protein
MPTTPAQPRRAAPAACLPACLPIHCIPAAERGAAELLLLDDIAYHRSLAVPHMADDEG